MFFVSGLIEAHNPKNVETFCYSDVTNPDAYTQQIRNSSDYWRDISNVNDEQLAAIIEEDKIDILIDLKFRTSK